MFSLINCSKCDNEKDEPICIYHNGNEYWIENRDEIRISKEDMITFLKDTLEYLESE